MGGVVPRRKSCVGERESPSNARLGSDGCVGAYTTYSGAYATTNVAVDGSDPNFIADRRRSGNFTINSHLNRAEF